MKKNDSSTEVNNNEIPKSVREMSVEEIESYRHTPETELSVLVCKAAETDTYADLKDYLEVCYYSKAENKPDLTLLHSERPKLHGVLTFLSEIGLM